MEKMINLYKKLIYALVLTSGILVSSCTDYLTVLPPSVIVHEDFWKTEAQVKGMAANAYLNLCNYSAIERAIVWGELRAETVDYTASSTDNNLIYLTQGLLYDDNSYATWTTYYTAINYCNLVMEYGPLVLEEDPGFTEGEMDVIRGQMLALRAYAHFMLVRAYCNVPLAMTAVLSDAEIPEYTQSDPLEALAIIYADLEEASGLVLKSTEPSEESLGYMTTNAVYSLMADVNMWQAAFVKYYEDEGTYGDVLENYSSADDYYNLAIENCQKVMDAMDLIYEESNSNNSFFSSKKTAYNLLSNYDNSTETTRKFGNSSVYETKYGASQNSRESIFEFQIDNGNYADSNNAIAMLYYYSSGGVAENGLLVAQKNFFEEYYETDDLRKSCFTTRHAAQTEVAEEDKLDEIYPAKYTIRYTASTKEGGFSVRSYDSYDAHWILYHKTDIMLMQAEALVSRSDETVSANDIETAFNMTKAINTRWRMDTTKIENEPLLANYKDRKLCLGFVRDERARELCYEGKRWFDIVRMALQGEDTSFSYGNKRHGIDAEEMSRRYNHISAYFMPIYQTEMQYNKNLVQNKSCKSSDDTQISQN